MLWIFGSQCNDCGCNDCHCNHCIGCHCNETRLLRSTEGLSSKKATFCTNSVQTYSTSLLHPIAQLMETNKFDIILMETNRIHLFLPLKMKRIITVKASDVSVLRSAQVCGGHRGIPSTGLQAGTWRDDAGSKQVEKKTAVGDTTDAYFNLFYLLI